MSAENKPVLIIDIGNTNIVFGIHKGNWIHGPWRLKSDNFRTEDEYAVLLGYLIEREGIKPEELGGVAVASVVPPLLRTIRHWSRKYTGLEPVVVGYRSKLKIGIEYPDPSRIGADRLANASAAYERFGAPVIAIDFGTAITFDVVNEKGNYCGGVICPGPLLGADELSSKTAKLPRVSLRRPTSVIGSDTEESIRSGLHFGTVGQVGGILDTIIKEQGWKNPPVVATGGLATYFSGYLGEVVACDPMLTLEGIRLIYLMNRTV